MRPLVRLRPRKLASLLETQAQQDYLNKQLKAEKAKLRSDDSKRAAEESDHAKFNSRALASKAAADRAAAESLAATELKARVKREAFEKAEAAAVEESRLFHLANLFPAPNGPCLTLSLGVTPTGSQSG